MEQFNDDNVSADCSVFITPVIYVHCSEYVLLYQVSV